MRKLKLAALVGASLVLFACSKSGKGGTGAPSDYDPLGEGNIPIAEPGKELKDINFDFDSSELSSITQSELRENSQWLIDNPDENVVIEGHCDERGTAEYNMALGLRRTQSVFEFLRSLGVDETQMSKVSYGEELPLDPSSGESAWAKNRRAHFSLK
ncbi:UNVERIFIED_CONTAM: hypothetical protein GTU68_002076 [Idotea baltica]|nr:hypothetical protein [Idotea baltica]